MFSAIFSCFSALPCSIRPHGHTGSLQLFPFISSAWQQIFSVPRSRSGASISLFFTSWIAASTSHADHCTQSLHFHLYKSDVIPRLNIFYVFTAIFIPLGSILLAHYIARTLSWRSLVAAIVLLLINVSVFSLYDRMIHLMQERHTALLIEKQNKAYSNSCNSCRRARCGCGFYGMT